MNDTPNTANAAPHTKRHEGRLPHLPALPLAGCGGDEALLGVTQGGSDKVWSSWSSAWGADTVHLSWPEGSFAVRSDSELVVNAGTQIKTAESTSAPLLVTQEGEVLEGYRGTYRDPFGRFAAEVRRGWGKTRLVVSLSAGYGTGCNFALPDGDVFRARWQDLKEGLDAAGIEFKAEGGDVERLDMARNVRVPRKALEYIEPLHRLVRVDGKLKDAREPAYRKSVWWKNGVRQLQMYVKRDDVLRVEWRAMGKESVARWFGVSSLGSLLGGYDDVGRRAHEMTADVLPHHEVPASCGGYEGLIDASPEGARRERAIVTALALRYLEERGEEEAFLEAYGAATCSRKARGLCESLAVVKPLLGAWDRGRRQDLVLFDEIRSLALAEWDHERQTVVETIKSTAPS